MITILIRTNGKRASLFARALESVHWQSFKNYQVIVGYDSPSALTYIPENIFSIPVGTESRLEFFYDAYCKQLAQFVPDNSWFFFLDDDDFLTSPGVLLELNKHLVNEDEPIVCQMLRNGVPKPRNGRRIDAGKIGLPCLVLHSKHKHLVHLDCQKAGDYRYIKHVTEVLPKWKFVEMVLVETDRRSFGA